jgi:predicted RNA-binding protein (virulence factor B family)
LKDDIRRGLLIHSVIFIRRDEDGKLDIGLRAFGGKAKADEVSSMILERLQSTSGGTLPVGDKSSPSEINEEFPGVSKAVFKKAVGALYKKGLVSPSAKSTALAEKSKR